MIALCPGATRTDFFETTGHGTAEKMAVLPRFMWLDAIDVAKVGIEAVETNRPVVFSGLPNRVVEKILRVLPHRLVWKLMNKQGIKDREEAG
jgi:uncharacterized protein